LQQRLIDYFRDEAATENQSRTALSDFPRPNRIVDRGFKVLNCINHAVDAEPIAAPNVYPMKVHESRHLIKQIYDLSGEVPSMLRAQFRFLGQQFAPLALPLGSLPACRLPLGHVKRPAPSGGWLSPNEKDKHLPTATEGALYIPLIAHPSLSNT